MKIRISIFIAYLLTAGFLISGCSLPSTGSALNPSYRMVTDQIAAIDSALGTRGGLASLTQTSEPPPTPISMSHGPSIGSSSAVPVEKKFNWALIGRRVSAIEAAWEVMRIELDRRAVGEVGDTYWYLKYYRIMAITHSFEMSLASVSNSVATKDKENINLQVIQLTDAFISAREELKEEVVDGWRLIFSISGFVGLGLVLTVATGLAAGKRDRKFVRPPKQ